MKEWRLTISIYLLLKYQVKNNNLNGKRTPDSFYEDFLNDTYIMDEKKAMSKKARLLLLKCRALCYTALKQQNLRCNELVEIRNFVAENSFLFDEMPRYYIDVLYNLANAYVELNEIGKVKTIFTEMNVLLNSKKILGLDLVIKLKSHAYTIELLILTYTGKFKEAYELALSINEFISSNNRVFNREDKAVLLFNLTNFYIYNNDYSLAEKAIEKLLDKNDKRARWDLKCYSRVQELIVCFELKQYSKIPLIVDALKILIRQKVFTTSTEIKFIRFFEKMLSEGMNNFSEKKFKPLHNELKTLLTNKKDRWVNFFYFNFYAYTGFKSGSGETKDFIFKNFHMQGPIH